MQGARGFSSSWYCRDLRSVRTCYIMIARSLRNKSKQVTHENNKGYKHYSSNTGFKISDFALCLNITIPCSQQEHDSRNTTSSPLQASWVAPDNNFARASVSSRTFILNEAAERFLGCANFFDRLSEPWREPPKVELDRFPGYHQ